MAHSITLSEKEKKVMAFIEDNAMDPDFIDPANIIQIRVFFDSLDRNGNGVLEENDFQIDFPQGTFNDISVRCCIILF